MHRVLLIPEVFHQIIEILSPRSPFLISKATRATLLNVALTCSSFLGPALDALWYSIDDLTALFKLLPNFLSYNADQSTGTPGIIWDTITEADVHTFDAYASRVRSFNQRCAANVDISAFHDILKACNRLHLLPNLQYFYSGGLGFPEHTFLISPRLRFFEYFHRHGASTPLPSTRCILNLLRNSSPNLTVLTLYTEVDSICLSAIGALKRLEELSIHSSTQIVIPADFLLRISARQTLRRLELPDQVKLVTPSLSYTTPNSVNFPMLEVINIGDNLMWPPVISLLRCVRFPILRRLTMSFHESTPGVSQEFDHWGQFFNIIGDVTTTCFESLHVDDPCGVGGFTPSTIPKLSSLSLKTFTLSGLVFDSFGSDDVEAIIKAWPLLIDLSLTSTSPKLGFSSIIAFAIGLPSLRKLELQMDSSDLPDIDDIPIRSHQLECLDLELPNAVVAGTIKIAQAVDRLFPNIRQCVVRIIEDGSWCDAQETIKVLQKARKDEAFRINSRLA